MAPCLGAGHQPDLSFQERCLRDREREAGGGEERKLCRSFGTFRFPMIYINGRVLVLSSSL